MLSNVPIEDLAEAPIYLGLAGVRSFIDETWIPIRPLTVLVGENSAGKSTILAMLQCAIDGLSDRTPVNFNSDPFRLGAFEDIASNRGGRAGKSKSFEIAIAAKWSSHSGRRIAAEIPSGYITAVSKFINQGGVPTLVKRSFLSQNFQITLEQDDDGAVGVIQMTTPSATLRTRFPVPAVELLSTVAAGLLFSAENWLHIREQERGSNREFVLELHKLPADEVLLLQKLLHTIPSALGPLKPLPIAPVRSRPKRSYDPVIDEPEAEGGHIPMLLARLHAERVNDPEGSSPLYGLEDFGEMAGLFDSISVQQLDRVGSSPFRIRVEVAKALSNLADVGYGVSQAIPMVLDVIRSPNRLILLQQPEVHLHPRAQAAVGSFFARHAGKAGRMLVVETHSDYLIDRLRMDVRDGRGVNYRSVLAVYLERAGRRTAASVMPLDKDGNLMNAPLAYREFFIRENERLFGG